MVKIECREKQCLYIYLIWYNLYIALAEKRNVALQFSVYNKYSRIYIVQTRMDSPV